MNLHVQSTLPVWATHIHRPPMFLIRRASPFLANDKKRYKLYYEFSGSVNEVEYKRKMMQTYMFNTFIEP